MVGILGSLLVMALLVIAGMWATIRVQRREITTKDQRIAELVDYVPPRAVQFVVEPAAFGAYADERPTDLGSPPALDLAAMGNDRPTLT